jgi:hypothetical protein
VGTGRARDWRESEHVHGKNGYHHCTAGVVDWQFLFGDEEKVSPADETVRRLLWVVVF